ncbi:MAG: hypothetical protein M1818_003294 [Claussenomyces sp. TS43310]|nr:MAG: hypothetical protein M1818_003294 [Claussenomyces sp. TS43310]
MTATGISNNRVERTTEIFNHLWPKFVGGEGPSSSSRGVTLGATNYEWPFELVIPGSMAESVEGLHDSHIMYRLKCTVARGKFAADLHAYKPLRIIRTLDPSALELAHAMAVENIWPNKIEYSMVIPQKAIIFGTQITVDMRFTSLLKGLRIGAIRCFLIESQEFSIPGPAVHSSDRVHKQSREVGHWTFEVKDEHYHDLLDDSGQDGYSLKQSLPLPKSLKHCMQDVETHGIKMRHKVKFNVALHNPDGHTSELRATLPITIFISPNMPLDEAGNLVDQTPHNTNSHDIDSHAPPLYGDHVLDQLYADMDNSGIMTPAPQSGMATPFYSQSQSGSHENLGALSSMDHVASSAVRPEALSHRLQNLASNSRHSSLHHRATTTGSGGNTPLGHPQGEDSLHHGFTSTSSIQILSSPNQAGYFDHNTRHHSNSAPESSQLSRRTSEEDENHTSTLSGAHTPEHIDYSLELNKVPSYSTAVRTPLRGMAHADLEALPNYDTAVSRPVTPVRVDGFPSSPRGGLPGHLRGSESGGLGNTHELMTSSNQRAQTVGSGMTPLHPDIGRYHGSPDTDAFRRLRLMQARGQAH